MPGLLSLIARLFGGTVATPLSPDAFATRRDPDAPLLDVRTPAEFAAGHLRGAVNVDVSANDFPARAARLGLPAEGAVYVYCASGARSARAVGLLHRIGHAGAVNAGGYPALRAAGAS